MKTASCTIRIRSGKHYSAEYELSIRPTIRGQSEYEANIQYSPSHHYHHRHCSKYRLGLLADNMQEFYVTRAADLVSSRQAKNPFIFYRYDCMFFVEY